MQWGCLPQARTSLPVLSSYAIAGHFHNDFALQAAQVRPGALGLAWKWCWLFRAAGMVSWGHCREGCRAVITQGAQDANPGRLQRAER